MCSGSLGGRESDGTRETAGEADKPMGEFMTLRNCMAGERRKDKEASSSSASLRGSIWMGCERCISSPIGRDPWWDADDGTLRFAGEGKPNPRPS